MAINHTKNQIQLGALFKVIGKRERLLDDTINAEDASDDRRLLSVTNGFGQSDNEEAKIYGRHVNFFDTRMAELLRSAYTEYRDLLEDESNDYFRLIAVDGGFSDEEIAAGAIEYEYTDTLGAIAISRRLGHWGALRRVMTADGFYVTANVATVNTFTAASGNLGVLAGTSLVGESHALPGTVTVEVVDESVTAPKLSVKNNLTTILPDGTAIVEADNQLEPEKSFQDGPTGLTLTLTRSGLAAPTEAGDDGSIFSASSIATPSEGDMAGGVLQSRVTRQASAPIWLVEFFKDSSRTTKVGGTTADGVSSTVALDVTMKNGTRFQTTFNKANANTQLPSAGNTDNDISFDVKTPRLGDKWTIAVANDFAGNFSTRLAKMRRASLPVSGATLYTDSNAAAVTV